MRKVAMVVLIGACSWATVRVPDQVPPTEVLTCPPPVAPVVDGAIAVGGRGIAVVGVVDAVRGSSDIGAAPLLLFTLPGVVLASVFTASAVYGVKERARCLRLKAEQPIRT